MAALPILLSIPFVAAAALGLGQRRLSALAPLAQRRVAARVAGIAALLATAALLTQADAVFAGRVARFDVPWLPALDVAFSLRLDGLAFVFALLITAIGALIVLYARYYISDQDPNPKFFALLLCFMGAMLGVALAGNLIVLVLFWELTSLSSFLLIGFWQHRADARQGARMALTITGAGGLALLAGVLLLGSIVGSYDLDRVLDARDVVQAHPDYLLCLSLILLGAFTKSAQFPFHFWLPHAMAAPTPVSAYLHSATMVKAGIFLLARLYPTLSGSAEWFYLVTGVGGATLLVGAFFAIFQHDLKGLLAYSTISHLGLVTMLLGLSTPLAAVAAVFHLLNHATFKASLFMAAGIIDHETGSRDMRRLNGLWKYMPRTAVLAIVAAAAMAGVPLLNGFLSKEMFFAETLALHESLHWAFRYLVPAAATLAGLLSVAYSLRFVHDVFFNGEPVNLPRKPHEPPGFMRVPVEFLVLLCVLVGLFPQSIVGPLLDVGARAVLGTDLPHYSLSAWHGLNLPLAMSAFALGAGVLLYRRLMRDRELHARDPGSGAGKAGFERGLASLLALAAALTQLLQRGGLRRTLALLLAGAIAAAALPLLSGPAALPTGSAAAWPPQIAGPPADVGPGALIVWGVAVIGSLAVVAFSAERLTAIILAGSVGLAVTLSFAYLSAPDLALTQLLVEVATVVLMMLCLYYLPQRAPAERAPLRKTRDGLIAAAAGGGIAAIAYAVLMRPVDSISEFFVRKSLTEGGGTNMVNVILVDFRGFDTYGELTVLLTAGIIVDALLRGQQPKWGAAGVAPVADETRHPTMLAVASRALLPFALLMSAYFFLRGHNLPGGGFIAGLVTAVALLLQFVARGLGNEADRDYGPLLGWGLLVATATGACAMLVGYPFLTSTFAHPVLPLIGEVPLASAIAFDLGVYFAVVGATLVALAGIGRKHGH